MCGLAADWIMARTRVNTHKPIPAKSQFPCQNTWPSTRTVVPLLWITGFYFQIIGVD